MRALAAAAGLAALAWAPAYAQDALGQEGGAALDAEYPILLDGTLSGGGDLADDAAPHSGWFRFPTVMAPWESFKERVKDATGITFGGSWGVLYQNYSDVPPGAPRDAVGQKFALNFSRDIYRAGTPEALTLDVVVEDRGPMGTDLAPLQAGFAAGSIVPTAATWGDFDLGFTQYYLRQNLWDNRFQYAIGKIFAPNFVDAYPFFDDNRQFLNQSFSSSPTIPLPLRGAGAVGTIFPTRNYYVKAGVYSANSSDTGTTINEVFDTGELFYQLELGWSALARTGVPAQARGPMDSNNVHLTFWYKDAQPEAENVFARPDARGVAFNTNMAMSPNFMWFVRAGISDGWAVDRAATVGLGWRPSEQYSDLFGIALGWVGPDDDVVPKPFQREQWTAESFYRFHLTPNFAVTPDLQYIKDPSFNPGVDNLWVASIRARITF